MANENLSVRITADTSRFTSAIRAMSAETTGSANKMTSAFKTAAKALVGAVSVGAIAAFGKGCIEASANAQAMSAQFSSVFGDIEKDASKSLSKIAEESGIMEERLKGSFTQIAAFAKTTGMDTDSALKLSERAMVAVADSAAFYDRSLEETTESLQSFLKGNYENDAALGLSCTETTRNAKANELYGKSFKQLSEDQKQLTLLAMVEDANKLSGAMGQAARESDTWANQVGNLKQAWENFKAEVGDQFIDIAIDGVKMLAEAIQNITPMVEVVADKIVEFKDKLMEIKDGIVDFFDGLKQGETVPTLIAIAFGAFIAALVAFNAVSIATTAALTAMYIVEGIAAVATTALGTAIAFLTSPITLVIAAIAALIAIGVLLYKNWDTVKAKALEIWNAIKTGVLNVVNALKQGLVKDLNNMKSTAIAAWNAIKSVASSTWNGIKSVVSSALNGIKTTASNAWNSVKNTAKNAWNTVKSTISGALSNIKSLLSGFKPSWSIPKPKLPKISVGSTTKSILGMSVPVPTFSVSWNAKGGIFNKPTIFNTPNGLQGVGERGAEAILPLNGFYNHLDDKLDSNAINYDKLARAIVKANNEAGSSIYLDGNALIGGTIERTEKYMGNRMNLAERGLIL